MASDASPDFCMSSIPSMIVELVARVSYKDEYQGDTDQSILLPAPAMKGITYQFLRMIKRWAVNQRLPYIQSSELGPDAFHSESVLLLMNHAPVSLCRDSRPMV